MLECTNMPPYTADVQRATGLPVFDVVSLVRLSTVRWWPACRPARSDARGPARTASAVVIGGGAVG